MTPDPSALDMLGFTIVAIQGMRPESESTQNYNFCSTSPSSKVPIMANWHLCPHPRVTMLPLFLALPSSSLSSGSYTLSTWTPALSIRASQAYFLQTEENHCAIKEKYYIVAQENFLLSCPYLVQNLKCSIFSKLLFVRRLLRIE